MTAYGNWQGVDKLAELAEEAAQANILRAEVEALRGELEAKNAALDRIATNSSCSWSRHKARATLEQLRKEETNA